MSFVGIHQFVENLKVSDPEKYKEFNFSAGELESVYQYNKFKEFNYSDDEMKEYCFFKTMSIDFYTKDNYIIQFMSHVIETSNKDVSNGDLVADISGLRTVFNQEMNLLEQKYGDKLHEVYHAVKLSNTELEASLNKEWNEAMDEYQKGNFPCLPFLDKYNPCNDPDYVESFEEDAFLVSIAMCNVLNKLPEYKASNVEDLSFNLDAAKEYNDSLTYNLVYSYPSMCKIYNDIVNDSTYRVLLDDYKEYCNNLEYEEYYEEYIANFQDDEYNFISTKDDYVMHFIAHIIDNCDRHVGNLDVDISGLMTAFNQEMDLLEQKYGDKLFEVYDTVRLSDAEIEHSLCKEWIAAGFPSVYNYSPFKNPNYIPAFEEGSFLSSIAMRNALNKLPEYMAGNIEDLAFNLDAAKKFNDDFLTYQLVHHYPLMCEKYNDIVNDSAFCAHLDYYKEHFVNANNHDYDAFENNEHDDVGDDAI